MVDLLERYLWNWGGRWSKPDAMHFEFGGTPVDADRMLDKAIRELLNGQLPPVGRPALKKGSEGPAVAEVQRMLNIKVDGSFGKDTEDAVKRFQSAHGLDSDGEVGPKTWAKLDQEANDMNGDQDRLLKEMHHMSGELHNAMVKWSIRSRVDDKDYNSQIFLSAIHGDLWEKFKTLDARLDRIEAAIKDPKAR
jgi:hypothetical protein